MKHRTRQVTFTNPAGVSLSGSLELPARGTPRAAALMAHCFTCSKDLPASARLARALAERGFAVLRFDFTGLGGSGGEFSNTDFSSNVDDLVAAAEWLRAEVAAPELLVGHSLGGAAVLVAAGRIEGVRAVATIGAPSEAAHLEHLLGDDLAEIERAGAAPVSLAGRTFTIRREFLEDVRKWSVDETAGRSRHALLVMHSPVDEIVGIDQARRIYEAARGAKSFVTLEDADHLLTRQRDATYVADVLCAWASRYLTPAEPEGASPAGSGAEPPHGEVVVSSTGEPFLQDVRAGRHAFQADEPVKVGGADAAPGPYEYLLAGLGACTSMTLFMYARHKQLPLDRVTVRLRHDRIHAADCESCESTEGRVDRIERVLSIEGDLDDAQRGRLLEIANRCPVHRTLENEITIPTRLA